jgi:hypothetical protein
MELTFFNKSKQQTPIDKKEKIIYTQFPPNFDSLFIFNFSFIDDTIRVIRSKGIRGFIVENYLYEEFLTDSFRKDATMDMHTRERIPVLINLNRETYEMDVYTLFNRCLTTGIITRNIENIHLIDIREVHTRNMRELYIRAFVAKNFMADTVSITIYIYIGNTL